VSVSPSKEQFEIVTTTAGAVSIRDNLVNEIMHNPVGPWVEANALYIEQSGLAERLLGDPSEEIIIFDIGLGAASNALAALHCLRGIESLKSKKLKMISFERDLELLKFALRNANHFAHFQGFEDAVESILQHHRWTETSLEWELRLGDFMNLLDSEKERPHIIFFDPYSPKANREVWTTHCFQKLYSISRKSSEGGTILYTYSQATPVRAAMLAAGFFVGQGKSTGLKSETTQAATCLKDLHLPLSDRWITRWKTSDTPYAFDCLPEDETQFRTQILGHPQFGGITS
jgi:tRNA U34 5-methylaminomethyl-2-thiouridine-forming methyltransferase MnmC